jgi:hypothetical protein
VLRPLLLLPIAGLLVAPFAANAEIPRSPQATRSASLLDQKPAHAVASVQAQRIVLRPMTFTGRSEKVAAIPVKDIWTSDEGLRFAKGRLAYKHRF